MNSAQRQATENRLKTASLDADDKALYAWSIHDKILMENGPTPQVTVDAFARAEEYQSQATAARKAYNAFCFS